MIGHEVLIIIIIRIGTSKICFCLRLLVLVYYKSSAILDSTDWFSSCISMLAKLLTICNNHASVGRAPRHTVVVVCVCVLFCSTFFSVTAKN